MFLMKKQVIYLNLMILSSGRYKSHEIHTLHEEKMHSWFAPPSVQA